MRRLFIVVLLIAVLAVGFASAPPVFAAPPPNDTPAGAEVIPGAGPFPYLSAVTPDISDATVTGEPAPSCAGSFSRSVWYRFTPPYDRSYTIATDETATSVSDTVLAVYISAGGPAGPFTQIACDDDGGAGSLSRVDGYLYAGTEYWIQVAKFGVTAPPPGAAAMQLRVDVDVFGEPLSAGFSYQGALNRDGAPVNATCDFRFSLYDAASGGIVRTAPQTVTSVAVVDGLFTTTVDLANQFRGDALWLQTEVQCPGDADYTVLDPRQLLEAVPYALGLRAGAQVRSDASEPSLKVINGSKAFVIDHPLDPANRLLYHFAVESPQVRNQYEGTVTLDQDGRAVVQLPDYFDALNADEGIHYQLTCVGGYAPVYIAQEVAGNQFTIAGGSPGLKVSWQISALRDDPYLRDNRVETETDKTGDEIGRYWYPAGYGQPAEQNLIGNQGKGGLPDAPPMEMKDVKP